MPCGILSKYLAGSGTVKLKLDLWHAESMSIEVTDNETLEFGASLRMSSYRKS